MIDLSDFDVPAVDDPQEQARLLAQAEGELADTLSQIEETADGVTEL